MKKIITLLLVVVMCFAFSGCDSRDKIRKQADTAPVLNMSTYANMREENEARAKAEFDGKGYGDFKKAVAEAVVSKLEPIQAKYNELMQHPDYLTEVYRKGAARATEIAAETIKDIHARIGYVER